MTVAPQESVSISHEFYTFNSIEARNYKLKVVIFYSIGNEDYTSVLLNQDVTVTEQDQSVDIRGVSSIFMFIGAIFFIVFIIFEKVQERISGLPANKRLSGHWILDTIREAISA